ncbi:MAG: hypothetical protein ACRDUY_11875 [Nitriliruptorales bacterium]
MSGDRPPVEALVVLAVRRLVRAADTEAIAAVLAELVDGLGGEVVDEQPEGGAAIALDVGGEITRWAVLSADPADAHRLEGLLPALLDDARHLATVRRRLAVLESGPLDPDTGILKEESTTRIASRLWSGDAAICIALDGAVDEALFVRFATTVRDEVRLEDHVGRLGATLAVLIRHTPAAGAEALLTRLRRRWKNVEGAVTFSAGIAEVGSGGGSGALDAARAALAEVQASGAELWGVAKSTGEGWKPEASTAPTSKGDQWSSGAPPTR